MGLSIMKGSLRGLFCSCDWACENMALLTGFQDF